MEIKAPVSGDRLKLYYSPTDLRPKDNFIVYNDKTQKSQIENNSFENQNDKQTNNENKVILNKNVNITKPNKQWFKAECILKAQKLNGSKQYLIKWTGNYKNSWVHENDVSQALVRQFYINKTSNRTKRKTSR